MKNKKTILFLSPVPWDLPNRNARYFASSLSRKFNVIFLDTWRVERINILNLSSARRLYGYLSYFMTLADKEQSLVKKPIILTFKKYADGQNFSSLDSWFFVFQIKLAVFLSSQKRKFIVWANTPYFPEGLKRIKNAVWFFEFYDRPFDFSNKRTTDLLRKNERWLVNHARYTFVNTGYYRDIATKLSSTGSPGRVRLIPVGYRVKDHLKVRRKAKKASKVVLGYEGGISSRLDFGLILSIAKENKEIDFVFLGPVYENTSWMSPYPKESIADFMKKLKSFANVKIIPSTNKVKRQVKILSSFSVGWIPYDLKVPFNQNCTPAKFFDYCAVGLPVISTPIPVLKEFSGFVSFIKKPEDFRPALNLILSEESLARIKKRKELAKDNELEEKYKKVISLLQKAV